MSRRARDAKGGGRRANEFRRLGVALTVVVGALILGSCYQSSPTAPELPPPRPTTTTTTTSTTTTTTMPGATTTTTTTSTTGGFVDYASQVHPIWGDEGCSSAGCHAAGAVPPNLSGGPDDSCSGLADRDGDNDNLIITGGGAAGSEILEKPNPGGISHFGGGVSCFDGPGAACWDTVFAWLEQGANGPAGTCGG